MQASLNRIVLLTAGVLYSLFGKSRERIVVNDPVENQYVIFQPHIEVMQDSIGVRLEDILEGNHDDNFKVPSEKYPFNENNSLVYWIRFDVENNSNEEVFLLDIHSPNLERLELFRIDKEGSIYNCGETGLAVPTTERKFKDKNLLIEIS